MIRLQWYGLQQIEVCSPLELQFERRLSSEWSSRSGHRHTWQHSTCGATVRRPICSGRGSSTHSVASPPLLSTDCTSTSNCFSFSLFNIEWMTDLATASSGLSVVPLASSWTLNRDFHRRFTRLFRLVRNMNHWESSSDSQLSSTLKQGTHVHSTAPSIPPLPSPVS